MVYTQLFLCYLGIFSKDKSVIIKNIHVIIRECHATFITKPYHIFVKVNMVMTYKTLKK